MQRNSQSILGPSLLGRSIVANIAGPGERPLQVPGGAPEFQEKKQKEHSLTTLPSMLSHKLLEFAGRWPSSRVFSTVSLERGCRWRVRSLDVCDACWFHREKAGESGCQTERDQNDAAGFPAFFLLICSDDGHRRLICCTPSSDTTVGRFETRNTSGRRNAKRSSHPSLDVDVLLK